MLDTDTKRRIDTARDILVGKLPDPKSQVEQITIALIYKFMDDMDQDALKLGGKATFFSGDFKKYAWNKIFDPKMSGAEVVTTYGEAIQKMNQNPHIPQLFRDMFKNAYLPYRDPETLKSFLKVIGEFEYDHSERLGDAFEYLLSVLGSQGDAGQFRTPRHIIDFMVELIDPKKNEAVLDPACGTAGFLISAYKHILKHNSKDFDPANDPKAFESSGVNLEEITINNKKYRGDKLTADDKDRIAKNIIGYDISPDMVRLSLVNMYLHGLRNPRIVEYDTLTSEEKWSEYAEVIMANPPFMSPKGGIRPHKRFSIESSRSEVLFVDYIAEHLTPQGRSAVIVPEGVIFQSQTTHKALRQMLIEKKFLVGVISLPAGVFNPYSGVKTSILWLDKTLAKKTDKILFVKISCDGFDLGAQRRPIKQNDFPEAFRAIQTYKKSLTSGTKFNTEKLQNIFTIEKTKIAETGDYNLSGDRYRVATDYTNAKWPMVELGEVCKILNGFTFKSEKYVNKGIRVIRITNVQNGSIVDDDPKFYPTETSKEIENFLLEKNDLLISLTGNVGRVGLLQSDLLPAALNQRVGCIRLIDNKVSKSYLFHMLNTELFEDECIKSASGVAQKNLSTEWLKKYKVPLPPIEIQERIAVELDGYQNIISGASQITVNWKPSYQVDPEWPIQTLGEIITLQRGYDLPKTQFIDGSVPVVGSNGIIGYHNEKKEKGPGVVTGRSGTIGKVNFIDCEYYWPHNTALFVKEFNGNDRKFIKFLLESVDLKSLGDNVSAVPSLDRKNAHRLSVSLPPLETQKQIVEKIEAERILVDSAKKLIEIYEQKTKDCIAKVWSDK